MSFQPGDLVELKSGGPRMTVDNVEGDDAFAFGSRKIPIPQLVKAPLAASDPPSTAFQ